VCDGLKQDPNNVELINYFKTYAHVYAAQQDPATCALDLFEGSARPSHVEVPSAQLEVTDLQAADVACSLCFEMLYDPLTPKCGHTFCRICLLRALDHNDACPMCRTALPASLNRQSGDSTLATLLPEFWPAAYAARSETTARELEDMQTNVPIFVCALLFPTIPLPLHIFEPRYRLMLRRCMESGTRRFGMVTYTHSGFSKYGTMAQIGEVQMLPDGRSLIDTTGTQRFKVLSHSVKDGYMVAKIEFIEDVPLTPEATARVETLAADLRRTIQTWINSLSTGNRTRLLQNYGPMPEDPNRLSWWLANVAPVGDDEQLELLPTTDLVERLEKLKVIWQSE